MEREARDRVPAGDWVADGGSDCRKDAGEEGGAMKGNSMVFGWAELSVTAAEAPGTTGSGMRTAWLIFLLAL